LVGSVQIEVILEVVLIDELPVEFEGVQRFTVLREVILLASQQLVDISRNIFAVRRELILHWRYVFGLRAVSSRFFFLGEFLFLDLK
jgi:hypothetical protein